MISTHNRASQPSPQSNGTTQGAQSQGGQRQSNGDGGLNHDGGPSGDWEAAIEREQGQMNAMGGRGGSGHGVH